MRSFCGLVLVHILIAAPQGWSEEFGYDGEKGPSHWGEKFSTCVGKHQSPIDISEHKVNVISLKPMTFDHFDNIPETATLTNNGHTAMVQMNSDQLPEIRGGPLKDTYRFAQFHFHWGENDNEGSENTINNSSFPMELHIVFYKTVYGSASEAVHYPDGLSVLSFLYIISDTDNPNYKVILNALQEVENPNTTTQIKDALNLDLLLVSDRNQYFTYDGSLTTPPCSEVVTWIEFKHPVPLSHDQLQIFRSLNSEEGKMTHNFRPTQPLFGRIIFFNNGDILPDNNIDVTTKASSAHKTTSRALINGILLTILSLTIRFS